jgi:hypothetical protein
VNNLPMNFMIASTLDVINAFEERVDEPANPSICCRSFMEE